MDLNQAQPHGRGHCAELLLRGHGELDGPIRPLPKPRILLAKGLVLPDQLFAGRTSGTLVFNRVADLSGLIIDGLTTTADLTCLDGNGTASAADAGGCIRDPTHKGYVAQGG